MHAVLERFSTCRPERLWLATTDADSAVPPDWLSAQLEIASRRDARGVAGTVAVRDWGTYSRSSARSCEQFYARGGDVHSHVHGANLGGGRADAYRAAGAFSAARNR